MENIISINLSTTTAPVVTEVQGDNYINYGTDDWANLYPQFLIDLYYNSSTQAAIINATAEMIAGEDLVIEDEEDRDIEAVTNLKGFFANANGNETLNEVIGQMLDLMNHKEFLPLMLMIGLHQIKSCTQGFTVLI
jgi:hypothetical protein